MLYPNESPFMVKVKPRIDLYEIERDVKELFEEVLGQGEVVDIYASQYPSEIGVTLFLKHYDREKVWELNERIEEAFASQGLRVGILAMPGSNLVSEKE